jgi:RNA polymerase sigma-70 factor (ECF subfamily)
MVHPLPAPPQGCRTRILWGEPDQQMVQQSGLRTLHSVSGSDEHDWARAVAGEGEAFGRVFDRHRDRVRRHARGLAPSPSEAEDVVSVTFLEAWRRRDSIRFVDQSMLPWLLRTATYTCMNLARSERRYRAALAKIPVADLSPDPAELAGEGDVFRALSLRDQEIITLCVIEDLSTEDAARLLGVRPSSARSRLSRARSRLRDEAYHLRPLGFQSEGVPYA